MGKIILVLGGARSGKSTYALELAKKQKRVAFVATCQGLDKEMKERIKLHRDSRPRSWQTFEEPKDIDSLFPKLVNKFDCILLDCLTLLVSNLLLEGGSQKTIEGKITKALALLRNKKADLIIVSNEVGLGIVPEHKLGRDFRDIAGKVNQAVAKEATEVFFTISGIPTRIKGGK